MTAEQLKRAKELQEQIGSLIKHLKELSKVSGGYDTRLRVKITNDHEDLEMKYLPINFEQYINLYVHNVEKDIAKLEEEFKNL